MSPCRVTIAAPPGRSSRRISASHSRWPESGRCVKTDTSCTRSKRSSGRSSGGCSSPTSQRATPCRWSRFQPTTCASMSTPVGRAAVHDEAELETATVGRRRSHYGGELGTRPVDADLEQRYSLSMDGHAGKLRSVHGECDAAKAVRFSQADAMVMRLVEEKDGRRARESGLG